MQFARKSSLPTHIKAKVESICAKAEHGELAGARTAAKEACAEIVSASPIPAAAKEQAIKACKSAAG